MYDLTKLNITVSMHFFVFKIHESSNVLKFDLFPGTLIFRRDILFKS